MQDDVALGSLQLFLEDSESDPIITCNWKAGIGQKENWEHVSIGRTISGFGTLNSGFGGGL